jgi:UPF0755 protein
VKRSLSLLLLAVLAGALGLLHWLVRNDAYGSFPEPVFVDIPRGTSSWRIGEELTKAGVVRNPLLYQFARLTRLGTGAKAGEYQFTHAATPAQVFARLAAGDVFHIDVVVPEGSTMFDIANLVERAGIGTAAAFLHEARSPDLIRDLAPSAPSLEGYLFPATYRFGRKSKVSDVCQAMTAQFRKIHAELGMHGDPDRIVTIASMVEKEAKIPAERPRIAGVYAARLRKGMKLDCDPTVMYAAQLEGDWSGVIRRSDLASTNRYNTYKTPGLPPGPIANPGRDSLRAALHPLETDDLYFVAEPGGTGAHVFSKDFAAHDKAVSSYRRDQRRRK